MSKKEGNMSCVALIPARSGSKRIKNKIIKILGKHPLIAYSIDACLRSKIFDKVICVTDDALYADIATYYGAEVPALRPRKISGDQSTDYDWLSWITDILKKNGKIYDSFGIIRPTSPFRTHLTIRRAWKEFQANVNIDSIRAVELCNEHPAKMWRIKADLIKPIMKIKKNEYPLHSMQYSSLENIYVQNASLEIAFTEVISKYKNISGNKIAPFLTNGYEGFDLNRGNDWLLMEKLIENNLISLKCIKMPPYKF